MPRASARDRGGVDVPGRGERPKRQEQPHGGMPRMSGGGKSEPVKIKCDLPQGWPILSIDFDGVLHSYISGWQGPRNIPDRPVPGAIEWLRDLLPDQRVMGSPRHLTFDVQVFSSRARYWGGRTAMKRWLLRQGVSEGELESIKFPLWKPPSFLHIDDRALRFNGTFPTVEAMLAFRPYRCNRCYPENGCGIDFLLPKDGPVVEEMEKAEVVYARTQPEYNPLRTLVSRDQTRKVLSRWEPTPAQRKAIAEGEDIFLELMTFGNPLQPIRMFVAGDGPGQAAAILKLLDTRG